MQFITAFGTAQNYIPTMMNDKEQRCIQVLDELLEASTVEAIAKKDRALESLFPLNQALAFDYANAFYYQAQVNKQAYYQAEMARCLGRFYIISGNMVYAYKFLNEAHEIAQKLWMPEVENRLKPVLYTILGYYFFYQKDYQQARAYTLQGVAHIKQIGVINKFVAGLFISQYINLTEFAMIDANWEEAKRLLDIAEQLFLDYDFPVVAYFCVFVHKAKYLLEVGQHKAAYDYLGKAQALEYEVDLQYRVLLPIQWTSYYIKIKEKDTSIATAYFNQAQEELTKLNMLNELTELYSYWGAFLEQEGDYQTALDVQKKYIQTLKDLKREESTKAILTAKYQQELREEQEARLQLQKELELKENFFLNITHDVKSTLFLILNPLEEIKIEEESGLQQVQKPIDLAIKNGHALLELSNRLLEVNRMVENKVILNEQTEDWVKLLHQYWEQYKEEAGSKGILYQFSTNVRTLVAPVDATNLQRIVGNLLSNAIKFTPENEKVALSLEYNPTNKQINILLEDTGIGIAKEDQTKVFEKFYQAHASQLLGGTGLGLTIVKYLSNALNFTLELESEQGCGTHFLLSKPIVASSLVLGTLKEQMRAKPRFQQSPTLKEEVKAGILIVDDHGPTRAYLAELMLSAGYGVRMANSPLVADELLATEEPDLILTDYRMPHENGLQFGSRLKNDIQTSHIPIILLTASAYQSEVKVSFEESGIDRLLSKPIRGQSLLLEIQKLLKYKETLRQRYRNQFASMLDLKLVNSKEKSKDAQFLESLLALVDGELDNEELGPTFLGKRLFMHSKTVYRKLQNLLGVSINEFIRKRRLYKAKLLLETQPNTSIHNIALEVGFSSLSYFTKCFKREFGQPPSTFKIK